MLKLTLKWLKKKRGIKEEIAFLCFLSTKARRRNKKEGVAPHACREERKHTGQSGAITHYQ
jgi:hypothetical protein